MPTAFLIDAVSNMYPAMTKDNRGYCYRLRAVLKQPVDSARIREAVILLAEKYPILYSHLEKGFASYRHIPATDFHIVHTEKSDLLLPALYNTSKPSFRIFVYQSVVDLDVYHGNGDGAASTSYLKNLLAVYFALADGQPTEQLTKKCTDDAWEDGYFRFFDKSCPADLLAGPRAAHLCLPAKNNYTRFSCFSVSASQLKAFLKDSSCTVNDYLTAALYFSIRQSMPQQATKPIVLSIPINLRPFFQYASQRNFSYFANVCADVQAEMDFEAAMRHFGAQIRKATQPQALRNGISAVVRAADNPIVKHTPLAIKEPIIRFICKNISFGGITTTLSNLGDQSDSAQLENRVERFEVYLGVGRPGGLNASAVGFGDCVAMCFSTASADRRVEERFAAILDAHCIAYTHSEQIFNET